MSEKHLISLIILSKFRHKYKWLPISKDHKDAKNFGNRKVEYIKPISKDGEQEKSIELIVQMYNQHQSKVNTFQLTTVTQKFQFTDIITLFKRGSGYVETVPGRYSVS